MPDPRYVSYSANERIVRDRTYRGGLQPEGVRELKAANSSRGMWWLLNGGVALILLIGLAWAAFSDPDLSAPCEQQPFDENAASVVESITSTTDGIEIRVWSREPFPVRALPPVLRIGEVDLGLSRYPEGGTLNTLIFIVSLDEFNQMASGDEMFIYYGSSWQSDLSKDLTEPMKSVRFSPFAKERRDCPPAQTPAVGSSSQGNRI